MKRALLFVIGVFLMAGLFAQGNVSGKWKTFDDETGEMKSIVEITIKNGKLYGTIVQLKKGADVNKICTECTDYRKGKKILGMEIINGLVKNDDVWEGDDGILDPEIGKTYDCKIWVEDNKLQVRGYIGFFFRTQTWIRA